jgi:hypothetical protein
MPATTIISTLTPIPTPTAPNTAVAAITAIIVKTITIMIQINWTKPNHANYKIIKQKIYERKKNQPTIRIPIRIYLTTTIMKIII